MSQDRLKEIKERHESLRDWAEDLAPEFRSKTHWLDVDYLLEQLSHLQAEAKERISKKRAQPGRGEGTS